MKKIKRVRIKHKRGEIVHLDTIYDVQAFCMEFLKPFNLHKINNWDPEMTDTFKCIKGFNIDIYITTNP